MMRNIIIVSILCFACCHAYAYAYAGEPAVGDRFPTDFKEKAFEHIVQLAEFGPRSAGAEGESKAFEYIRGQLEKIGVEVQIEKFDYETFQIEQLDFTVCREEIEAVTIGFNPYERRFAFDGEPLLIAPGVTGDELNQMDLKDRIVVTTAPVDYFTLIFRDPQLIVYVSNSDFNTLAKKNCSSCSMAVKGSLETHTSANMIAELTSTTPDDSEVIISAHWDSYRNSPGADDNGSGVGVLLELARFFSTLEGDPGGTIKFVFFGSEELGVVGSRAYLDRHQEELEDCVLVFNIDNAGGPNGPSIEMLGGVQGIPKRKGATQFPTRVRNRTFEGLDGRWRMTGNDLIDAFMVTNRPPWLVEVIETSAEQYGFEITPRGNLGSDQQVFTQAGIVATGIGTWGNRHHSPEDVPAQINKDSLEVVGKIVANVVILSLRDGER